MATQSLEIDLSSTPNGKWAVLRALLQVLERSNTDPSLFGVLKLCPDDKRAELIALVMKVADNGRRFTSLTDTIADLMAIPTEARKGHTEAIGTVVHQ